MEYGVRDGQGLPHRREKSRQQMLELNKKGGSYPPDYDGTRLNSPQSIEKRTKTCAQRWKENPKKGRAIVFEGIEYPSLKEAGRQLGKDRGWIARRLK